MAYLDYPFERELMLEEITFYSLCTETDRKKIMDDEPLSFEDFERFNLLCEYLSLKYLKEFLWDMHGNKFADRADVKARTITYENPDPAGRLLKIKEWMDSLINQAPNEDVAVLLRAVFLEGRPIAGKQ